MLHLDPAQWLRHLRKSESSKERKSLISLISWFSKYLFNPVTAGVLELQEMLEDGATTPQTIEMEGLMLHPNTAGGHIVPPSSLDRLNNLMFVIISNILMPKLWTGREIFEIY